MVYRPDIERLETLAKAATPGAWSACGVRVNGYPMKDLSLLAVYSEHEKSSIIFLTCGVRTDGKDSGRGAAKDHAKALRDQHYIANMNPDTTLSLIEYIRYLETELTK